jgi:zinc metalloprotease ZmpA
MDMKQGTRPSRQTLGVRALRLAVALALGATAGAAGAADRAAAVERALTHIEAFPGRTLHGAGQSYTVRDVMFDTDGSEHVRVERRYLGLRVIGGDMVVHSSRSGSFVDASRTLTQPLTLDIRARLSAAEALREAQARHGGEADGTPELVVFARGERPRLAWDVRLSGVQADGTPSELHVIVDAGSAAMLDAWDDIHTAPGPAVGSGTALYDGVVPLNTMRKLLRFTLTDSTRGNSSTFDMNNLTSGAGTVFVDKRDNLWGDGTTANRQTVAVDAAHGGAVTWDYYKNVHGRNGIANDGVGANSRVHYGTGYENAFWSDSCFCMTYGDGGATFNPLVSLDVAGHEMSHGVTSRTAGLIYSGESGGLNEGTSDIFGTMVEFYANNPNDPGDYLIGEMIMKAGGSLRSMIMPSVDGRSADCWYSSVGSIDVHYSSGIANHFYFLLAEGTSAGAPSKTCAAGDGRVATANGSLTGITRAKAEKIWYRALTVYMTTNTNYAAARAATLSAAADLYGAGSPEASAVAAAWTAVKVN